MVFKKAIFGKTEFLPYGASLSVWIFLKFHVSGNKNLIKHVGKYVNGLEFLGISLAFLSVTSVRVKVLDQI